MSRFELPIERLATTDENGARLYLQPDQTKGYYYRLRNWVHPILLVLFLTMPWIRIRGEPLILLDVPDQRFILFGATFYAHDVPLLFFLLALFTLTIAFVTAVWGRVWCGWACPQTVFIEAVFRRLEKAIEGYDRQYRRPALAELTRAQWGRKILKWLVFTAVTLVISHCFIAYFVGTDHLRHMIVQSPFKEPGWFLFMAIVTGVILFDFGWFREQFCAIACPYGRIQSVFMDEQTKVVAYDYKRGEPRRGPAVERAAEGDCVNCYRCVQVCPTGIDIRRGTQLECIGCTNCIDACDEVMLKVKKPEGLIRHASMAAIEGRPSRVMRPRIFIYLSLIALAVAGLVTGLALHKDVIVQFVRAVDTPYQLVTDAAGPVVINHYHAELWNGGGEPLRVTIAPAKGARAQIISAAFPIDVAPGTKVRADFFVKAPEGAFTSGTSSATVTWAAESAKLGFRGEEELKLVGPVH